MVICHVGTGGTKGGFMQPYGRFYAYDPVMGDREFSAVFHIDCYLLDHKLVIVVWMLSLNADQDIGWKRKHSCPSRNGGMQSS